MFAQAIETKIFDNEDYIPTPAWIYYLIMLSGAALGIVFFFTNIVESNVHPVVTSIALFIGVTIIAMAMMNAVMRCNSAGQMAGSMCFALFGGIILMIVSAIVCFLVIAVLIIVVGIWLLGALLGSAAQVATSEEITVERGGLFGGTKKVLAHKNWNGTATGLDGKVYKKKNSWF